MADFVFTDDHTLDDFLEPGKATGLVLPEGFQAGPAAYEGVAQPFPRELVLDDATLERLIKEREDQRGRHRDVADAYGLKCKDQGQTNYCWVNGPTYCLEYIRLMSNLPAVPLSPASAGGPIKGFRNQGGWGRQALEWIETRGLVPTSEWPDNAIDSRYYTDANRALALNYRTTEWWVFDARDLRAVASCVVGLGVPASPGYNWWGHQVSIVDFVWKSGTFWPVIRNSWGMGWKDMGYAVLEGSRAYPDDCVAPAVPLAS